MYYHSYTVALPIRIMDISCSSKSILWQSAICVAVLTMMYVVALSDEDVCIRSNITCTCSSPLTSGPPRPSFAECSVGELPDHLTSLNDTCGTNVNVSCNTVCMFECDAGYTITHKSIVCKIGRFTPDIPSCNETNECDSNPCQNNGTCNDLIDDYNCTCVPGYEGKNCENPIVCTVPMDVTNYTTCNGSVLPLTICDFKCNETGNASVLVTCNATGSWSEVLPTCGSLGLNATTMNMTMNMTRRETLPLDNQDVLTVQETFESAILGIPTTYLVIVTTISAQNLSNGEIQMNLLIGVMYTSDVTVESLIEQIEEALLAVDEFSVVSVDVTVTVPSTGTSASNPPTESTSSPSSTPSSTEPVTVPSTGTLASNPLKETISTSSLSQNPSPTEPATVPSTGISASNPPTASMSSPSSTPSNHKAVVGVNALAMRVGRKRRETLPLDNQDVLTVQDTFESAILGIPTTYLVNVTTISAQSLLNGQIQMNLLIGVIYKSDVTVESLIEQIEEALLAVDEFSVVSVDVTDLEALCSPTPCKNNGECRVDYNTLDYTCVCASGYSGPQCSNSPNDVLLAILVPIAILILLVIIFFVVLVVYYRVRLHKLDGYKKRPFHYDVKARRYEDGMQLYFTEDRRYQHQDPMTFKNSAMGLRFSKEINARMQVRSQQMELHGHHPSASHHDPTGRHRSRTDPIQSGRSLHDRPVTGDKGFQGHRPNGMRSRGNPSLGHETGNGSVVYNEAARRSVNDRNMVSLGRSRNGSMPADMHIDNGFSDTRL